MISVVNPWTDPRWETIRQSAGSSTVFHQKEWARVLHDTYAFSPQYLLGDGDAAAGNAALPLMEIDSWMTGKRGVSLPFTDECEPLSSDAGAFSKLFDAAVNHGRSRQWRSIEFRGGSKWLSAPPSTSFLGHHLRLRSDIPAMFNAVSSSGRRAIRKAEQSGLEVEFSTSLAALKAFYELLRKTRQRHGLPPQPFRFFENIQRNILSAEMGTIVLTRKGATAVAGAVFLHSGPTVIYKYGASDDAFQELRGNNLVMWRAIERYALQGYGTMDFGRTSLGNEGLRRFKLGWGSTEHPIHYYKYDLPTHRFTSSQDRASGWHARAFRMLPRSVSQWIGAALYKHIA
jgi:hypothetical protein